MIFFIDDTKTLWEINEENLPLYNNEDILIVDDENLPAAVYPLYKLDENNNIIPDDTRILDKAKHIQIRNIEKSFDLTINAGYVCSNGIKLFSTFDDIQKYKAGLDLMKSLGKTETYIKDYEGNYHSITIDDLQNMITELGVFYMTNWQKQGDLQDKIKNATNVDDVLKISWDSDNA